MKLEIAKDLALPIAAVTEKLGFLGRTGSGKSYAAMKLAEEMYRADAQFVVLDPVGIWYGLRLDADGKRPGLPIPVLGGLRGDIPLEPTGGALIANLVVDRGVSMIIDVSQFESDADKARFAQAFADRFFFRKKAAPSAVHVFIEEAQEFVPQNPQREEARMLHAFTRLMKIGRNFGIGGSLISQRPQEVNKKVLNLVEVLFTFQMTGPQERKTIEGWIAEKGLDEDISAELPKLAVGSPHVWSPAWLKISKVVHIAKKSTMDVSSTPTVGKKAAARDLSPIDLEALRKEMTATIEKAQAEDPRLLRAEIARLRTELAKKPTSAPSAATKKAEQPRLNASDRRRLEEALKKARGLAAQTDGAIDWLKRHVERTQQSAKSLEEASGRFIEGASAIERTLAPRPPAPAAPPAPTTRPAPGVRTQTTRPAKPGDVDGEPLGKAPLAILRAAVQRYPKHSTRAQLAILSGYSVASSSFDNALGQLRSRGLMQGAADDNWPTDEGITAAGEVETPPTGRELLGWWQAKMGKAPATLLAVIVGAGEAGLTREDVSAKSGYSAGSSSFDNAIGYLRTVQLVHQGWPARAAAEFFE